MRLFQRPRLNIRIAVQNDLGLSSPLLVSAAVLVKRLRRRRRRSTMQNGSKLRRMGKELCGTKWDMKYTPSLSASYLDGGGDADGICLRLQKRQGIVFHWRILR